PCDRLAVDHHLDRHLARVADAAFLQVPAGPGVPARLADGLGRFSRLRLQQRRDVRLDLHLPRLLQAHLAPLQAHAQAVDREVHQVALAVADVAAPLLDALGPVLEAQLARHVHVTAPDPHALAIDAGEVRLPADATAVADVQRVIPDVQLPDRGRVHR